jgi:hypothetical protein
LLIIGDIVQSVRVGGNEPAGAILFRTMREFGSLQYSLVAS